MVDQITDRWASVFPSREGYRVNASSPAGPSNGVRLTVERGKIVLAEFGYGGVMKPSFPSFLVDGTKPSRTAWFLKEKMLPPIYWKAMLKGREWMAKPEKLTVAAE